MRYRWQIGKITGFTVRKLSLIYGAKTQPDYGAKTQPDLWAGFMVQKLNPIYEPDLWCKNSARFVSRIYGAKTQPDL